MKYPTDMVNDDGWSRLHCGHNLDKAALEYDLRENSYACPDGAELHVEEVYFRLVPRVKWCERLDGWACDNQGEWHSHWVSVRPNADNAFTVASWGRTVEHREATK